MVDHFTRDLTLIFKALVKNKYKSELSVIIFSIEVYLSVLRGGIGHFLRDPTLIFKALVKNKY